MNNNEGKASPEVEREAGDEGKDLQGVEQD